MKKNSIVLTAEQRRELEELISSGEAKARKLQRAHILLKADCGPAGPRWSNREIHEAFDCSESTVCRARHDFTEGGLDLALNRRPQPERPEKRKLDGEQEAHLVAVACQQPPDGYESWTFRLLAEKLVELEIVESVSHETVRTVLKKTNSSRG